MRRQEVSAAMLTGYMPCRTLMLEKATVLLAVPSWGLKEPHTYGPFKHIAGHR